MRRNIRRLVSAVMVMSLMLSLASCKKETPKKREIKKITDDTPWFTADIIDVEAGTAPDKGIDYMHYMLAGADDDYIVVYTFGRYQLDIDETTDAETFNSANFYIISVVDRNTNEVVNTIDLADYAKSSAVYGPSFNSVLFSNGIITAKDQVNEKDIDPLTGELLDSRRVNSNDDVYSEFYTIGDYVVDVESHSSEYGDRYNVINIVDQDKNTKKVELKELGKEIYVEGVLSLGGNKAVVPALTSKGSEFYELDLISGSLTKTDAKEYDWLDVDNLYSSYTGSDGQMYYEGGDGIYRINAEKKENEEVFKYSWCGLNQGLWHAVDLVEYSEKSIIYIGETDTSMLYSGSNKSFQIIELTRADKNPHAGKTILELYSLEDNAGVGKAVEIFNETNGEYFIEIIDDYDIGQYFDDSPVDAFDSEAYEVSSRNAFAGLSNDLAIDIMSGEGPDILINTSRFAQLNNPDYLVDLSPYLKDLDSEDYFMNIIEGAKTDGAVYQLPVSFSIWGIMTDAKAAGASGVGFTFDEYADYIKGPLNGYDVISSGQPVYFAMLFNSMKDRFIRAGKVDLSGPEFEEIAGFVKDNVPEHGVPVNDLPDEVYNFAHYGPVSGIGGFFLLSSFSGLSDSVILGTPSVDGRGPMVSPSCSVAVSAQATDIGACTEFVKILLSEDIQESIAMEDQFVISRKAFCNAGAKAIEYYNSGFTTCSMGSGVYLIDGREYTMDDINHIADVVSSCSNLNSEDQAMSLILIEEMPAYFVGQKDLTQVIDIAQNRMQKILDERG